MNRLCRSIILVALVRRAHVCQRTQLRLVSERVLRLGVRLRRSTGAFGAILIVTAVCGLILASCTSTRTTSRVGVADGSGLQSRDEIRHSSPMDVLDFLDVFVMNVPSSDLHFRIEEIRLRKPTHEELNQAVDQDQVVLAFAFEVLDESLRLIEEMPRFAESVELHSYFVSAFRECQERLPWPGIRLFEDIDGRVTWADTEQTLAYVRDHELSYVDYLRVRAECAHSAARYPNLGTSYRDALLGPQREYFQDGMLSFLKSDLQAAVLQVDPTHGPFGEWRLMGG